MPTDSDEEPRVPIVCDDCETTSRVPLSDAAETIAKHNEQLHDGDDIAQIDPDIVSHVTDLAAEDLGLSENGA